MKSLIALLCITLTVFVSYSLRADTDGTDSYDLSAHLPAQESRFPIDFSWITNRYDFQRIEKYIDEYYGTYYKSWEKYVTSKQREIAGRVGLSDIFFKLNLKNYEDTKIVLSRRLWNDKLLFRYLAPVGDMRNFDLFVAVEPHRLARLVGRGSINGEVSVAIIVNRPFGSKRIDRSADRRTRKLLGQVRRMLNCD